MRILILTQWYPPEPALLLKELAQTLLALGHQVTVLTGFPNYPSGRLYPGYRLRLYQREVIDGVPIVRVIIYPEHSRSAVKRVLNYFSFAVSSLLIGPWLVEKPEIIFTYHPPLTVGLPAIGLRRIWRIPFVYQIQDLWPETLSATGMLNNRCLLKWVAQVALTIYAQASHILVISPGFKHNLIDKGIPAEKIDFISNWIDPRMFYSNKSDPVMAAELGLANRFNIMFAGNVGEAQGLETVIEAAVRLHHLEALQFVIVGDGTALSSLQASVQSLGLNNVIFLGRFPETAMSKLYALADVLLVHLKDDPLFRITIPHKILAYMSAGKPILAAVAGDAADLVATEGAGIVCQPSDPVLMAETVERFFKMDTDERCQMGAAGRFAVKSKYSRVPTIIQIETTLERALADRA